MADQGARNDRGFEPDRAQPDGTDADPTQTDATKQGRNRSNKPLPGLSERGGVDPIEGSPPDYNDRTRDRTLKEP